MAWTDWPACRGLGGRDAWNTQTFTLLTQRARGNQGEIGLALGLNTLGGALAPALFGVMILPLIGAKWSLGLLPLAYLLLLLTPRDVQDSSRIAWWSWPAPVGALLLLRALQLVTLRNGEQVIAFREGVLAAAAVVEHRNGARNLRVNNRYQMGGTSAEAVHFQRRQAHLPILLHERPEKALFLGIASGVTIEAAARHPGLGVDAVELVPEVLDLLSYFSPANGAVAGKGNVSLYTADARRFVRVSQERYDVIVADLYHPARDGARLLFTREHYRAIAARLREGGLFCHWLPFHQLDMDMIRLITRTFLSVFSDARLLLASDLLDYPAVGLVTGFDSGLVRRGYLVERVEHPDLRRALQQALLSNDLQLFSTLLLDHSELRDLAGEGPLNVNDKPTLSYQDPRFTYDRGSPPNGRLMALLAAYEPLPSPVRMGQMQQRSPFLRRLQRFVEARNLYLQGRRTHMEAGELAAVRVYLASARTSREHLSAMGQLYRIAERLADRSPGRALAIANTLYQLRPDLSKLGELQARLQARSAATGKNEP